MIKFNVKISLIAAALFLAISPRILAVTNGFQLNSPPPGIAAVSLAQIVVNVTNWILGFVTILAVLMLIWGGAQYLISMGDEAAVQKAKNTITYAILGLIIVGISYAVVALVVNVFIGGQF